MRNGRGYCGMWCMVCKKKYEKNFLVFIIIHVQIVEDWKPKTELELWKHS